MWLGAVSYDWLLDIRAGICERMPNCLLTLIIPGALPGARDSERIDARQHKDRLEEDLRQCGHHKVGEGREMTGTLPKTDTHQLTNFFLRVCSHDKQHQTE